MSTNNRCVCGRTCIACQSIGLFRGSIACNDRSMGHSEIQARLKRALLSEELNRGAGPGGTA